MTSSVMNENPEVKDFTTHFNYIKCMNGMMSEIKFNIPINKNAQVDIPKIKKFLNLATLTRRGISSEISACKLQPDYSEIVAPWIAVKCYYRIYYLESVLIHLAQGHQNVFKNGGHAFVRRNMNAFCQSGYVTSSFKEAEKIVVIQEAQGHKIKTGSNISSTYCYTQDCIKSVRAKVANYVEEHWKANEGIKSYSSAANKTKRDSFRSKQKISLFDYFYQMRLKANYKDLDFLKFGEISSGQAVEYVSMYGSATQKYCKALEACINKILLDRSIKL